MLKQPDLEEIFGLNRPKPALAEIEDAVDHRRVWALMRTGVYWQLRRNGQTQTWKRNPGRFRIPVKAGLKSTSEITEASDISFRLGAHFVISTTKPHLQ